MVSAPEPTPDSRMRAPGKMSASMRICSSATPAGTWYVEVSANGEAWQATPQALSVAPDFPGDLDDQPQLGRQGSHVAGTHRVTIHCRVVENRQRHRRRHIVGQHPALGVGQFGGRGVELVDGHDPVHQAELVGALGADAIQFCQPPVVSHCQQELALAVELQEQPAQKGDVYLLCSDGLSDMIEDDDMGLTITTFGQNLNTVAQHLVQLANDNGGKDNISVLMAQVLDSFPAQHGIFDRILKWFS